jgi:hypothetical protein
MGNRVYWMGFPDRVTALERVFALDHNEDTIPSSKENTIAERNIFDAYGTIMAYFTKQLDTAHIFNAFRVYLLTRVYLISIDVDEPKDVAMAFEVINDRGIPLKAHEILKGKILGAIDKEEVQSYVDMWEQSLAPLATCYDDYDETDDFFCILFRAKFADTQDQYRRLTLDKYHKAIYYEEFDRKIGFHINGVEDDKTVKRIKCFVSSDIPYFSKLYLRLIEDSRDWDKPSYALFNAENGQNMQYYLLLSSVESNDPQENEKYALVTRELDRLYMLCHLFSSYYSPDFNRRLVELGKQIRGASLEDCKAAFQQTLVKIISSSHNQRDESDPFKYSYFAQLGYSTLSKHFLRYFFSRIEHFIGLESELPCGTYWQHLRQVRGKDMHHIEHILAWDDRGENCEAFPDEDTFTRERNRLGALVLLKGKDDASSRNELYAEKLKTYFGNGTLWAQTLRENFEKSNIGFKEFREKYNLDIKPYDTFGQTAINERHRLLFEIVRHIWQF